MPKVEWSDDEVPADTRAVSSGSDAQGGAVETATAPEDLDEAIKALRDKKPLLVYYYVQGVTDPGDANYKISTSFEMECLGTTKVVEFLNKEYRCTKVALPMEADMKVAKNQARIEIYGATDTLLGTLGRDNSNLVDPNPLLSFLKVRLARSESLARKEIARLEKEKADLARREKEEAGKPDAEVADAR